jgi:hypothetical protein
VSINSNRQAGTSERSRLDLPDCGVVESRLGGTALCAKLLPGIATTAEIIIIR